MIFGCANCLLIQTLEMIMISGGSSFILAVSLHLTVGAGIRITG